MPPPDHPLDLAGLADAIASRLDVDALAAALADRIGAAVGAAQRFFSVRQAAEFTGLSTDSIRHMLTGGRLTPLRPVAGRVVIDKKELENVILASTGRPARRRGKYDRAGRASA